MITREKEIFKLMHVLLESDISNRSRGFLKLIGADRPFGEIRV